MKLHLADPKKTGPITIRVKRGEGPFYLDFSEATDYEKEYIEWSIRNEGKGTQFMRYFSDEEGADLRKNPQEYSGYLAPRNGRDRGKGHMGRQRPGD